MVPSVASFSRKTFTIFDLANALGRVDNQAKKTRKGENHFKHYFYFETGRKNPFLIYADKCKSTHFLIGTTINDFSRIQKRATMSNISEVYKAILLTA